MTVEHRRFWCDLLGRIGAPILAATLVSCLLTEHVNVLHGVLMAVGTFLIYVDHRATFHISGE